MVEEKKNVEKVVEDKDKELTDLRNAVTQLVAKLQEIEARYNRLSNVCNWLFNQYVSGGVNDANK